MATARRVVNLALRKLGVVGGGRDARESDAAEAMAGLQALYSSWIASGVFGRLTDRIPKGETYIALGNERVMRQSETELSVVLPELVSEEWISDYGRRAEGQYGTVVNITTVNGDVIIDIKTGQPVGYVQPPRDGSPVVITDQDTGHILTWLYDGTLKKWQQIELLQMDDEAPRSTADVTGLAACLAMEIADQFGSELSEVTVSQAARYRMQMTHRYGMRRVPVPGVYY